MAKHGTQFNPQGSKHQISNDDDLVYEQLLVIWMWLVFAFYHSTYSSIRKMLVTRTDKDWRRENMRIQHKVQCTIKHMCYLYHANVFLIILR